MKTVQNFGIMYLLLVVGQMFICNYFHLSMYVTLSILPVIVLYIPLSVNTVLAMLIAFATGLSVDALSESVFGLNALALVPVALCRKKIIKTVIGEETVERQETFSVRRNGLSKISAAVILSLAVFFTVYILADGAGVRPVWFNLARFAASIACSYILSLFIVRILTPAE